MSRTGTLALALLVALIGAVAALVYTKRGEPGASDSSAATAALPARPAVPASAPSDAALVDAPAPAKAAPAPVPASAARSTVSKEDADPELAAAIWIDGRVVFPEGTPLDEEAFVVGRGKKFEAREPHRARVGTDGRFRVAFAEGSRRCRVDIEARYLYLDAPESVDLKQLAGPVELRPRLGGHLEVALIPPDASAGAAGELRQSKIELDSDDGAFRVAGVARMPKGAIGDDLVARFGGLVPHQTYDVTLAPETLAPAHRAGLRVEAGRIERIELRTRLGATVRGRVVDEQGRPVPEASVSCGNDGDEWYHDRGGETADDGTFELRGAAPGKLRLAVSKEGYVSAESHDLGTVAGGHELDGVELVLREGGVLAGVVKWPDGRPAGGARIRVKLEEASEPGDDAFFFDFQLHRAADDGTFRRSGLPLGRYAIDAQAEGPAGGTSTGEAGAKSAGRAVKAVSSEWNARLTGVVTGTTGIELVLGESLRIAGRVVDDTGAPLERFRVRAARATGAGSRSWEDYMEERTGEGASFRDPGGRFALDGLEVGSWRVSARGAGRTRSAEELVSVPGAAEITLVVPRAATVSGTVVDPAGAPLARIPVRASIVADSSVSYGIGPEASTAERTDAQGRFELKGVAPGRVRVVAGGEAFAASEPLLLELAPAEQRAGLVLTLRVPGRLEIEIGSSIEDRAGRSVWVAEQEEDARYNETLGTDASGRLAIEDLDPGHYWVSLLDRPGEDGKVGTSVSTTALVEAGATVRAVLGASAESGIRVSGRATRAGAVIEGARVEFRGDASGLLRTETDVRGEYEQVLPGPGEYSLGVAGEFGRWSRSIDVPDAREWRLDIDIPTGRVAGRVTAPDGEPRAGVLVALVCIRASEAESFPDFHRELSDRKGAFDFTCIPPGRYVVVAGGEGRMQSGQIPPGGLDQTLGLVASREVEVDGEHAVEGLEIRLPEAGVIVAVVRDAAGAPVAGATVELLTPGGHPMPIPWGWDEKETNASGTQRLNAVAAGTARLRARLGERTSAIVAVDVDAGRTSAASLVLGE